MYDKEASGTRMDPTYWRGVKVMPGVKGARGEVEFPANHPDGHKLTMVAGAVIAQEPEWPVPAEDDTDAQVRIQVMRDNGIVNPLWTWQVCTLFNVPLFFECAFLEHESYKGMNLWHNDDTWMRGQQLQDELDGLEVPTEASYHIYLLHRARFGAQGIGPNALTHPTYQTRGDFFGGCWKPRSNMAGAVSYFAEMLAAGKTMDMIAAGYNPGSPTYLETHKTFRQAWRTRFRMALGRD